MKINTRKQAIDEKCKDCNYDSLAGGTWKEQIENCNSPDCSLYDFRPLTASTTKRKKEEKYALMTPEQKAKYDIKSEMTRQRFAK